MYAEEGGVERMNEAIWEHRFWLQILGDHARFIESALAPVETADAERASAFISRFDALLAEARRGDAEARLGSLTAGAAQAAGELRSFKLDLLARQLAGRVKLLLTPSFLNHMVNELQEYMAILDSLLEGKGVPVYHPLHHDLLWLSDGYGHAASIAGDLDLAEKPLIERSLRFRHEFEGFYLKAVELAGYLRTGLRDFPALRRFHRDVDLEMRIFMHFLAELREMELTGEVLDRLQPLVPDHMYREECYYLTKLAAAGAVPSPECDPGKPRVEGP